MILSNGFPPSLKHLNALSSLDARHIDIQRSLITVGYQSRDAALKTVGPWRAVLLLSMAEGYLSKSMRATPYFQNLEQSEKVGVSFLLGQAFTHWYAQSRMGLQYLLHVESLKSHGWTPTVATSRRKKGAAKPANKSRPDFVGFAPGEYHIFESKGRQRNPDAKARAKALGQVSKIEKINGSAAVTRCATFFMMKSAGVEGIVDDPQGDDDAYDLTFDVDEAAMKAYAFFLSGQDIITPLHTPAGEGFVGAEIQPNVFLGADRSVVKILEEPSAPAAEESEKADRVQQILESRRADYEERNIRNVSVGTDGIILIDNR